MIRKQASKSIVPSFSTEAETGNLPFLMRIVESFYYGGGSLPERLGLPEEAFFDLSDYLARTAPDSPPIESPSELPFDLMRNDEREIVLSLLLNHRAMRSDTEIWIAWIVATACLGSNHLWQDLGLESRDELSDLLFYNFPELSKRNTGNMKWKKFFYKQFCIQEGINGCKAPECSLCIDYKLCFGPE